MTSPLTLLHELAPGCSATTGSIYTVHVYISAPVQLETELKASYRQATDILENTMAVRYRGRDAHHIASGKSVANLLLQNGILL